MRTIAITNFKGGVGKTTCALNLAYELASRGERVLLIDLDPQAVLSHTLRNDEGDTLKEWSRNSGLSMTNVLAPANLGIANPASLADVISKTSWEGVYCAPANLSLQRVKDGTFNNPLALKFAIDDLKGVEGFDWVIVDTHPDLDIKVTNAIVAADQIIIPIRFDGAFAEGLRETIDSIKLTCDAMRLPEKPYMVLPSMIDARTGRDQAGLEVLKSMPGNVFGCGLRSTVKVGEATMRGLPLAKVATASRGGGGLLEDFSKLADEVQSWKGEE